MSRAFASDAEALAAAAALHDIGYADEIALTAPIRSMGPVYAEPRLRAGREAGSPSFWSTQGGQDA